MLRMLRKSVFESVGDALRISFCVGVFFLRLAGLSELSHWVEFGQSSNRLIVITFFKLSSDFFCKRACVRL